VRSRVVQARASDRLGGDEVTRKRTGFTLIELLVVIAIIGILAAMLFPVFARARESARKTQCLANVKNIAMAVQIYLTDYDAFPPKETNADALTYFDGCWHQVIENENPYLRWPVVLDEYTKSREIWRCPSAKLESGAMFIVGVPDPLAYYRQVWPSGNGGYGTWPLDVGPCAGAWPNGWGGTVTDSIVQNSYGAGFGHQSQGAGTTAQGAFLQSIGCSETGANALSGMKVSAVDDSSALAVVADAGTDLQRMGVWWNAYPDTCQLACMQPACCQYSDGGYQPRAGDQSPPNSGIAVSDASYRKSHYARHLGGSNVGFADGHAKWWDAEAYCQAVMADKRGERSGISSLNMVICGPNSLCGFAASSGIKMFY
jgi:prepilin-type N-terminal cleavage/methylation domain-containing protein/prepilin-type processing-associated H-X9-DG protein